MTWWVAVMWNERRKWCPDILQWTNFYSHSARIHLLFPGNSANPPLHQGKSRGIILRKDSCRTSQMGSTDNSQFDQSQSTHNQIAKQMNRDFSLHHRLHRTENETRAFCDGVSSSSSSGVYSNSAEWNPVSCLCEGNKQRNQPTSHPAAHSPILRNDNSHINNDGMLGQPAVIQ